MSKSEAFFRIFSKFNTADVQPPRRVLQLHIVLQSSSYMYIGSVVLIILSNSNLQSHSVVTIRDIWQLSNGSVLTETHQL